ncbi:hypothetical protein AG1IA_10220 [Rhizoctonia solani AG-1 IA]|uniref:Uncharacterized protein n=1 Tax=Thanatephorus cucumeris (strain AG1-IA) TaxID=983506 RepID=L8WCS6_THACA|nr:hypothetical protein AG1IA_10220 [Rhizoctonia solani AG-1 IA]
MPPDLSRTYCASPLQSRVYPFCQGLHPHARGAPWTPQVCGIDEWTEGSRPGARPNHTGPAGAGQVVGDRSIQRVACQTPGGRDSPPTSADAHSDPAATTTANTGCKPTEHRGAAATGGREPCTTSKAPTRGTDAHRRAAQTTTDDDQWP